MCVQVTIMKDWSLKTGGAQEELDGGWEGGSDLDAVFMHVLKKEESKINVPVVKSISYLILTNN